MSNDQNGRKNPKYFLQICFFTFQDGYGDSFSIMFWGFLGGSVISLLNTIMFEKPVLHLSARNTLLALGHGAGVAGGYIALDFFSKYVTSTVIAMVKTLTLVVLLGAQYTILHDYQPGNENVGEICGVMLVIIGNIIASLSQNKQ